MYRKSKILEKCWNTEDPITFEDLTNKSIDEMIMIPSSHKKKKNHCFLVESLFQWYTTQDGPIKNPLDPSRILTDDEIYELIEKMTKINPKMVTNLHKFEFIIKGDDLPVNNTIHEFYHLYIIHKIKGTTGGGGQTKDDLGVIPVMEEGDISSLLTIDKLEELWDTNRLFWPDTSLCCRIQLKFKPEDWFDRNGTFDEDLFLALEREIDRHLA
jgi:hypothetical protein